MYYHLITSVIGFSVGILIILFREKLIDAQRKYAQKKNDLISKMIAKQPRPKALLIASFVGIFFILSALINFYLLLPNLTQ
jgi:phosphatidylglycerophosphate synthase